ncbi:hypothetical protein B0T17DRAFT_512688 [Bombardia bombarda]|uniref:Uncharacterized protein n=1 Tax=Bombardia bombarda TaxID=252184 RepID=A0AA39TLK9_9PEZI|nr:hypothetical protein B0T17DRAFT_512688 [Bombardia bombarda]
MKITATIASLLPVLGLVAADALHLTDCNFGGGSYSEILYYTNDADSYSGQAPADQNNICQWVTQKSWTSPQSCTFRSGVTVTTNLSGASSVGAYAGTASNGYHNFNCYKDSGRVIYTISSGSCNSLYYCLS